RPARSALFPTRRSSDLFERGGRGHAAPGCKPAQELRDPARGRQFLGKQQLGFGPYVAIRSLRELMAGQFPDPDDDVGLLHADALDRKSTRLNSSHVKIS